MKNPATFFRTLPLLTLLGISALLPARAAVPYANPVMAGDFPDPSVIRVGKDYWATATSSEWGPQFPLLHSKDLVNWEVVGSVFTNRPAWAVGNFWAPEIIEWRGRFYVYYVARKKGGPLAVAVASAAKPSGPYTDHGPMIAQDAGSIDPVLFEDEKGQAHLIWKEDGNSRKLPTILWMAPLSEDGTKLVGEPKEILRNDKPWEGAVIEGPFIVKRAGWFYLFYAGSGCCGTGCNYAVGVARSKSLHGPWEKNPQNPIVAGNADWKCPGHGSIVADEKGRSWFLYHAYSAKSSVFTGREGMLDEVKFGAEGWPTINNGQGPSSRVTTPSGRAASGVKLKFEDEFKGSVLKPGWNWPVSDEPRVRVQKNFLTLRPQPDQAQDWLGGILARSITTGDFVASTSLDNRTQPGTVAGLAAVGDRANATGVAVGDGKLQVWHRARGQQQIIAEVPAPKAEKVFLRLTARGGQQYRFAYGTNGKTWTDLEADASGKHLPPWDRAVRVAVTVGGGENAEARFDFLRIAPLAPAKK